jgi:hypothetical protein
VAYRRVVKDVVLKGRVLPSLVTTPPSLTSTTISPVPPTVRGRKALEKAIIGKLVISQSTVHTHTVHIYAKCGVSTRAGLAMFAMRHGLAARTGPTADAEID